MSVSSAFPRALFAAVAAFAIPHGDPFDSERDLVVLTNGKELRGIVLQSFLHDRVVLLRENRREDVPREEIARVSLARERLAAFLRVRRPGLSLEAEWTLVEDAERAGLHATAALQAQHVLLCDPGHERAHEFLGHERRHGGWEWPLDGKQLSEAEFVARSAEWNHRLVLDSEHFTVETNCGLRRAVDVLFDLEALYVWWMEQIAPAVQAAEDVDDPLAERMTFHLHRGRDDPSFLQQTSDRWPYYDPSGAASAARGGDNVVHTYYTDDGERPLRLFELGTEVLMYSTLVLGRTIDEADFKLRRLSHWIEVGLGYWVARHCGGAPGYVEIAAPFVPDAEFALDQATAIASLERPHVPHLLRKGPSELVQLVALPWFELEGEERDVPLARARCATFVSYLIAVNPLVNESTGRGARDAVWSYLRDVYGTQRAYSAEAFEDGLSGGKVEQFEERWKSWTRRFQ